MDRGKRRAEVEADRGRLAGAERPAGPDDVIEGFAPYELHPEPDAAVVFLRPVDLDDVGMADSRHSPRFFENAGMRVAVVVLVQQLQRDVAVELRVPRLVDFAGGAFADAIEQDQAAPPGARRSGDDRVDGQVEVDVGRYAAVERGNALDEAQVPHQPPIRGVRDRRFDTRPIDRRAVSDGRGQIRECPILTSQRPSPQLTAPAPASPPSVRRRRWPCRTRPQSARNSAAARPAR